MIINGFGGSSNAERQLSRIARSPSGQIQLQGTGSYSAQQLYENAPGPVIYTCTINAGTSIVCNKEGYRAGTSSPYALYGILADATITLPNEYQYLPCHLCFYINQGNLNSTNGWTRTAGQNWQAAAPFVGIKFGYNWASTTYFTSSDRDFYYGNYYGPMSDYISNGTGGAQYAYIGYYYGSSINSYSGWPNLGLRFVLGVAPQNSSVSGLSATYTSVKTFTLYVKIWPCKTYY